MRYTTCVFHVKYTLQVTQKTAFLLNRILGLEHSYLSDQTHFCMGYKVGKSLYGLTFVTKHLESSHHTRVRIECSIH